MKFTKGARNPLGAAPNEMHNFYFVTFVDCCRGPIGPSDYAVVKLYGEAFGLKSEGCYQVRNRCIFGYLFLLSID